MSYLHIAALAALLAAGWALDHMHGSNARQADQITSLRQANAQRDELIATQAKALEDRQAMSQAFAQVSTATHHLQQQLDRQGDQLAAGLEDLKRNDPASRDYLLGAVPAAVGMRHARPETTDPAAYREAAANVPRADPVPAARSPSHSDE